VIALSVESVTSTAKVESSVLLDTTTPCYAV
jgi:hypothetical protein